MNKQNIKELLSHILSNNRVGANQEFKRAMSHSVSECIQERQQQLAKTYFNGVK